MPKFGFIRDGYTVDGFIAESDFHPEISFQYRPMLPAERLGILRRVAEADIAKDQHGKTDKGAVEGEKILIAETAARVVSWDLCDDQGQTVAVNAANMARVEPHLLTRIFEIIAGTSTSDLKAKSDAEDAADQAMADSAKN